MAIVPRLSFFNPQTRQEKIKLSLKNHRSGGFFNADFKSMQCQPSLATVAYILEYVQMQAGLLADKTTWPLVQLPLHATVTENDLSHKK